MNRHQRRAHTQKVAHSEGHSQADIVALLGNVGFDEVLNDLHELQKMGLVEQGVDGRWRMKPGVEVIGLDEEGVDLFVDDGVDLSPPTSQ